MFRFAILFIVLFVLQTITTWTDSWTKVQREINQFDSELSQILYPRLLSKWFRRVGEYDTVFLDNGDIEKNSNFSTNFQQWALIRFFELCQDKPYNETQAEVCTYLKLVHKHSNQDVTLYQRSNMLSNWNQVRIKWQGRVVNEVEVGHLMEQIQNPLVSKALWLKWHQQLSNDLSFEFENKLKELSGRNFTKLWKKWYQNLGIPSEDLINHASLVWTQLKPFYNLFMNYIIKKLSVKFPEDTKLRQGKLSSHLLKSLQGTQFDTIYDLVKPFPEQEIELTQDLIKTSIQFYRKLGFTKLPEDFWKNSRVNLTTACHPFTSNLYENDVRIVLCKGYTQRHVFHELGHAYTFLSYAHSGYSLFRFHVNEALHESVGELMSLFYNDCQLTKNFSQASQINLLFREALTSLVRMPYALSLEIWRYKVFSEYYFHSLNDLNKLYWNLRSNIQGIFEPKMVEFEDTRLDPLDKYHVIDFQPYLSYFYANLLQHQLFESICGIGNQPCCPVAQNLVHFRNLLREAPYSVIKPQHHKWSESVEKMFGRDKQMLYTTQPLLRYYQPLIQWLQMQ